MVPSYWPALRYGGTIRSSRGLCAALAQAGLSVEVATTNVDGPGELDVPTTEPVALDGTLVHYCATGPGRRIYRSPQMRDLMTNIMPKTDLVHIHAVFLWPGLMAARLANKCSVPYVLSPRGMLVPELIDAKSAWVKKAWITMFERRTLAQAAAIHVTSSAEAAGLHRLGLDLAPIHEIPNGVVTPPDFIEERLVEEMWQSVEPGRRLLYLGRVNWKKGLDLLLRCLPRWPGTVLQIAGNDEENLIPCLRDLAVEQGIQGRLRWLGEVVDARKWALLAGADLLVVPSINENFGNVVTEALAVGTPVVCTEGVGARSLIARLDTACVVPREETALVGAVAALLADSERRSRVGEAGRKLVAEAYSWPSVAERMIDVYREIARRHRTTRA